MQKYLLNRIENGYEVPTMQSDDLDSARKQGEAFNEGYAIYETKLVEKVTPSDNK